MLINLLKKKKKLKLLLNIKQKNIINCKKLISKIFYNLTYIYIKNNFSLINKLLNFKSLANILLKNHYKFVDNEIYNDLFILKYLNENLIDKDKTNININKNKKSITINTILKKFLFSNSFHFRFLKDEKKFLKTNIYNLFFFLFYYYMKNNSYYSLFLKTNQLQKKKKLITFNIFLKKNLKQSFKFFFKNIIMFLYKFSLIKNKKQKLLKLLKKSKNKLRYKFIFSKKKNKAYYKKRKKINYKKNKYFFLKRKKQILKKKNKFLKKKKQISNYKKLKLKNNRRKNVFFLKRHLFKNIKNKIIESNIILKKKLIKKKNIIKKKKTIKKKKIIKKSINKKKIKSKKKLKKTKQLVIIEKKTIKFKKIIINQTINLFKHSLKKKKKMFFFKKLFCKKTLVKRMFELSFKKDNKLKNSISILKDNKKFKFLTFPINSICKFFFKNSMYNIFMTLIVLPLNLTIISYSGGHFNILSKRRDRGSINSLKSMSKIIALKIYQSNLSFVIFCPRLSTNNNKRLIKTIFYSFKILNRSPITKIYLYRPVIRNGIRSKKIPRK